MVLSLRTETRRTPHPTSSSVVLGKLPASGKRLSHHGAFERMSRAELEDFATNQQRILPSPPLLPPLLLSLPLISTHLIYLLMLSCPLLLSLLPSSPVFFPPVASVAFTLDTGHARTYSWHWTLRLPNFDSSGSQVASAHKARSLWLTRLECFGSRGSTASARAVCLSS
ncbi:hypothetical protein BD626DRAFT_482701 [Schizophyllum amplum]|uniref:Uncharacterized protein n=1 Tax=Schizophyllum amplum TaxID=97359 RepID=A0A550CNZ1_9AGAR|nr:hypothetical protein BD626DRAFT_482701 [Auriculariopsis ampla]